jgi:hypothetical protein
VIAEHNAVFPLKRIKDIPRISWRWSNLEKAQKYYPEIFHIRGCRALLETPEAPSATLSVGS